MSKKVITIGYEIPGHSDLKVKFSSKQSLMDSDIVLLAPELPYYETSSTGGGYYQGKRCYGETGSFELQEDVNHWKKEILNSLNAGKTVFLLLSKKEDYFVDTGRRTHSGSGRNRITTINVSNGNNYEILPIKIGTIHSAKGKEVVPVGLPLFKNLFEYFKSYFEYQLYIENPEKGKPIFTGNDKTKILGAICKVGLGHLVLLPYIEYNEDQFTQEKINKTGKTEYSWTKKAIEFGNVLVANLTEIDKNLKSEIEKVPPPAWVLEDEFKSKSEIRIGKQIQDGIKKIEKIKIHIEKLQKAISKDQVLKGLLYEQGKPLEDAVILALKLLGYKAENYNDGELELDQVISSPEGHRYIGECEGKNEKDIDISKFRQLLESMSADFAREEVQEKPLGILFGNPQRLMPLQNRTLDFTQKCKIGAKREGIALIKTSDLYRIALYLQENKDLGFQEKCRQVIQGGLGEIVLFPQMPS